MLTIIKETVQQAQDAEVPQVKDALLSAVLLMLDNMHEPAVPDRIITVNPDRAALLDAAEANRAVTPTVQSDGYEFEVAASPAPTVGPPCTHQHQKLVGKELRCANCDTLLQITGVVGKTIMAKDATWAQAASEGTPDGPNREG